MKRPEFSFNWALFIGIGHGVLTLFIALAYFSAGMATFNGGNGSALFFVSLLKFWNPLAMFFAKSWNMNEIVLSIVWSAFLGILGGFVMRLFRPRRESRRKEPYGNPDLVGTPWEQKNPEADNRPPDLK